MKKLFRDNSKFNGKFKEHVEKMKNWWKQRNHFLAYKNYQNNIYFHTFSTDNYIFKFKNVLFYLIQ